MLVKVQRTDVPVMVAQLAVVHINAVCHMTPSGNAKSTRDKASIWMGLRSITRCLSIELLV